MSILLNNDAIEDIKCWVNDNSSDIEYVYTQDGKLVFSKYTEIEDSPPLLYNSKKNNLALKNYRIYGNTVNSESVGDRTENLFDNSIIIESGTVNTETGADSSYQSQKRLRTSFIGFLSAGTYTINADGVNRVNCIALYSSQNPDDFIETVSSTVLLPKSFTLNEGGYIRIAFSRTDNSDISQDDISNIMLNAGSEAITYEPYGYRVPVKVEKKGENLFDEQYYYIAEGDRLYYRPIYVGIGTYTLSTNCPISNNYANIFILSGNVNSGATTVKDGVYAGQSRTVYTSNGFITIAYRIWNDVDPQNYHTMLSVGSTALPYEPHYPPVTVNLYLPEQIKMVGDEAEYIDYKEQKQHFADGTSVDVILPALPTLSGTNTLSVGTQIQPSSVYLKGKIQSKGKMF